MFFVVRKHLKIVERSLEGGNEHTCGGFGLFQTEYKPHERGSGHGRRQKLRDAACRGFVFGLVRTRVRLPGNVLCARRWAERCGYSTLYKVRTESAQ